MMSLNLGQQTIINNIYGLIQNQKKFNIFLCGPGGSGKSIVIKAIYQMVSRLLNRVKTQSTKDKNLPVILSAFTGKAAYNIDGLTLHSMFCLRTFNKSEGISHAILMKCQKRFKYTCLFIIDEISLVSSSMFSNICDRVQAICKNESTYHRLSMSFLVSGDFRQLKPVGGNWIFKGISDNPLANVIGNGYWLDFEFFELIEIMRQKEDIKFVNLLNKIGDLGIEFLDKNQCDMLNSRIIKNLSELPFNCIILASTNKQVAELNKQLLDSYNDEKIISEAFDYIVEVVNDKQTKLFILEEMKKYKKNDQHGLQYTIILVINKPYMITRNIDTSDGLTNGQIGKLKKIIFDKNNNNKNSNKLLVKRIYLQFENNLIGIKHRQIYAYQNKLDNADPNWISISLTELSMPKIVKQNLTFRLRRIQLPVIECSAITIHKSQGATLENVCVYFSKQTLMDRSHLYVALSRVKSINGLFLYGCDSVKNLKSHGVNLNDLKYMNSLKKKRLNEETQKEMNRMKTCCQLNNKYPFLMIGNNFYTIKIIHLKLYNCNYLDKNMNNLKLNPIYKNFHQHLIATDMMKNELFSIMFLNIRHLTLNKLKAMNYDYGFMNSDIILLSECHTRLDINGNLSLFYKLNENYELIKITGTKYVHGSSHGQVCYAHKRLSLFGKLEFLAHNCNSINHSDEYNSDKITEICLYTFKFKELYNRQDLYIFQYYVHPQKNLFCQSKDLVIETERFLKNNNINLNELIDKNYQIIFIGDFNLDFNENDSLKKFYNNYFFNKYFLKQAILNICTFPRPYDKSMPQRQLDWVLTNSLAKQKTYEYTTWFSDHKPLYTSILQ